MVVSIDSTGPHLHRRGYRMAHSRASIRENLAAGVVQLSGWDEKVPLVDPFCGAGTIPIEAALIASGRPPGMQRGFAFQYWKDFDGSLWEALRREARQGVRDTPGVEILAGDISGKAVEACMENAERAGVSHLVRVERCRAAGLHLPGTRGIIVMNPPYGRRMRRPAGKGRGALREIEGLVRRLSGSGWRWAIVYPGPVPGGSKALATFSNGGIRVGLWFGQGWDPPCRRTPGMAAGRRSRPRF